MTLFVHRAASTDVLADGLAELLATPLEDPFAEEVVAVPAKGVERWLAQRLSHRLGAAPGGADGVCAGVRFLNPHSLVALVLGVERDDPWHPEHLAWPVLRAVDASLGEPWASTLATHLGYGETGTEGELRRGRRYAVARRLAGLFADYAAQRPAMLADWREGGSGDGLGSGDGPGTGGAVADDLAWQPELWRRVLEEVGGEPPDVRQARVVAALRERGAAGLRLGSDLVLPGRLSLFGHTRIARSEVEVLGALGEHLDVHLWLPQASPAAWDALAPAAAGGPVPRSQDTSAAAVHHPLLASLGRDARELQRTLALAGGLDRPLGARWVGTSPAEGPPTLLRLLQHDLARDHVPSEDERQERALALDTGADGLDRSVQVHACHGQTRQVEVLRDVLAGLLERDPTLEPRDILVMCPDIDAYAPLVHAGFGLGEVVRGDDTGGPRADSTGARRSHPAHGLRVRLADRAPRHTNPLLALADRLVELAGGRVTAGEVLDLARSAPVRQRFGLDDDALERLGDWVEAVVVRWGLDAEHRADYQLSSLRQNTWRAGLDRVLVGAVVDGRETDHVGQTLALDDLDSGDLDLAGRLAELVDRLGTTLRALRAADTAEQWLTVIGDGVLGLADVPHRDAWQVAQLERELARVGAAARSRGGSSPSLSLSDVHALLREQSAGRATRSNFRTGTLTVCTMVPMRSVPHRVVCLVGMDDGVFPRSSTADGDDALARRPVTGERDLRSEDRQLLLDAVMSARDTLVVTYTGADEHSGQERPPAVPLGELLDAVRATAAGPAVERVLTRHPLQPFDRRNLGAPLTDDDALLPGGMPFSFDPSALAGALAQARERAEPVPIAAHRLPAPAAEELALEDLLRFFDNPARAFLRSRLGMLLPEVPELRGEGIPIELDGLQKWDIGERMLQAVLAGQDPVQTVDAERWRGSLPPDELGRATMEQVTQDVQRLCEAVWRAVRTGTWGQGLPRDSVDVDIALPGGRHLVGTVPGLVDGHALTATYSTVRAKQRLRAWVVSLVLAAAGHGGTSRLVGRYSWGKGDKSPVLVTSGPHDPARAVELLDALVRLRDRGVCEVLPLPVATAATWAETFARTGKETLADNLAAKEWVTSDAGFVPGEQDDPSWRRVLGGSAPYPVLTGPPQPDETWHPGVTSRLGQLALRVWGPVLDGAQTIGRP
ncbi:exodeoxyribonuclease V subunit gamma [Ornithinimicrobium pekingense]|uniref:RecBCD enzyme subunit RecC n=1 Tax=Ornithinimicrobium pekingense TaxID=384677 RepID=A0ABQ2F8G3_9MICO|nr:exodeoxyribonuclease V subunit gamma [Ornithinimicrobium pekingense]GGK71647.1 RecBCD enzyme subunit RecC [Ornithinimicrobium pekingense]